MVTTDHHNASEKRKFVFEKGDGAASDQNHGGNDESHTVQTLSPDQLKKTSEYDEHVVHKERPVSRSSMGNESGSVWNYRFASR